MQKQTIQTTVGIFVIIGLLFVGYMMVQLGEVSIIGDDSYPLFARFSSVSGLQEGSAVEMMGIKIGQVEQLTIDQEDKTAVVELQIKKGIKILEDATAAIVTAGLIGEKFIKIDAGDHGEVLQPGATIAETESTVEKLPLDKLVKQALRAAEAVDLLVRSPELMGAIRALGKTMSDAQMLVRNVDRRVLPLAASIETAVRDAGGLVRNIDRQVRPLAATIEVAVKHAHKLVQNVDDQIVPLAADLDDMAIAVRHASEQAEKTFFSVEQTVEGNSRLGYVLTEALGDLSAASRSIRALTEYLERHPEAVLFGKR
ncbi:MAG: MCE family protein [Deltaproteobacteria bacterium]|nr:MCE family protein [Deltaproteobacteria bacterium]